MSRLCYGVFAALTLCSVTEGSAQDPEQSQVGGPKPGTELLVFGDGDDPWPELTRPKTVRRTARRTNSGENPAEPPDAFEEYLKSLNYIKTPASMRSSPGMLVVDYHEYDTTVAQNSAAPSQPGQLIGEIPPDAAAGPAPEFTEQDAATDTPVQQSYGYSLGGESVGDGVAPWQAQIYYPNIVEEWQAKIAARVPLWALQHFCGGAMIAPNWVITAAHCIDDGMRRNGYRIRMGQEDVSRPGGYTYKIAKVVVHHKYVARENAGDINDIALIKITNDTGHPAPSWRQVRPIEPYWDTASPNQPVSVFGWGRTNSASPWNSHAFLMRVGLQVMPQSDCTPFANRLRWSLDDKIICAKAPTGTRRKTCKGDSGGPVVASGKLLAVVSGGSARCTDDGVPSMYTRIAAYRTWINGVTGRAVR